MRMDRGRSTGLYEIKGPAIDFHTEMFKGMVGSVCSDRGASSEIIIIVVVPP